MAIQHVLAEVKGLSRVAKIGAALGLVLALIGGTIGLVHHFEDAAATKKEQKAEEQRKQDEAEKQQLREARAADQARIAELEASRDAFKKVAETKRADQARTAKELEAIEREHNAKKAEIEAGGGTLSNDELQRLLCEKLRARGYTTTCE